jgi:hypothetical protein
MQLVVAESSRQIPRGPFGVVGRSKMLNLGRPHGRLNIMANWVLLSLVVLCILFFLQFFVFAPSLVRFVFKSCNSPLIYNP